MKTIHRIRVALARRRRDKTTLPRLVMSASSSTTSGTFTLSYQGEYATYSHDLRLLETGVVVQKQVPDEVPRRDRWVHA